MPKIKSVAFVVILNVISFGVGWGSRHFKAMSDDVTRHLRVRNCLVGVADAAADNGLILDVRFRRLMDGLGCDLGVLVRGGTWLDSLESVELCFHVERRCLSHNSFSLDLPDDVDYASVTNVLRAYGFANWTHLPSSEGFVLQSDGKTVFSGHSGEEIAYSVGESDGSHGEVRRPVALLVKKQRRLIIARATGLGD